jgi:hypothetical protein
MGVLIHIVNNNNIKPNLLGIGMSLPNHLGMSKPKKWCVMSRTKPIGTPDQK